LVDPNVIALVVVTLELNIPVVNTNPFSANVPLVKVTVPVAVIVKALAKLVVPVRLSMVNVGSVVLVPLLMLPVPTIVGVKLVYVPPLANVRFLRYTEVTAGVLVLPVKVNVSKKLPVVNVGIEAPLVNASLGGVNVALTVVTGAVAEAVAVPLLVTVNALMLVSVKKLALFGVFNNNDVCEAVVALMFVPELCDIVNGLAGTVKLPVYTATPLVTRKLEILPAVNLVDPSATLLPIVNTLLLVLLMVKPMVTGVPATPFTYEVSVLPLRTKAK